MKKSIMAFVISILLITNVSAQFIEKTTSIESEYKTPIIDNDLKFEAERNGSKVFIKWNSYEKNDFKYYKIMRSETNSNPVYPDQPALKYFDNADQKSYDFGNWSKNSAVYRVCIITTDKSRICSNVVKVPGYAFEKKEYIKDENAMCIQVIQPAYNTETGECREFSTPCSVPTQGWKKIGSCSQISNISDEKIIKIDAKLQVRADRLVSKLIQKFETKYGSDDKAKIKKVSDIIVKLEKINTKIKSEKVKALVIYLIDAFDKKLTEYNASDSIEDIFNTLEE